MPNTAQYYMDFINSGGTSLQILDESVDNFIEFLGMVQYISFSSTVLHKLADAYTKNIISMDIIITYMHKSKRHESIDLQILNILVDYLNRDELEKLFKHLHNIPLELDVLKYLLNLNIHVEYGVWLDDVKYYNILYDYEKICYLQKILIRNLINYIPEYTKIDILINILAPYNLDLDMDQKVYEFIDRLRVVPIDNYIEFLGISGMASSKNKRVYTISNYIWSKYNNLIGEENMYKLIAISSFM